MPTSVPGTSATNALHGIRGRQSGFSLLELLIVLAIIGIVTAVASISAFPPAQDRALQQDARRLAQLLPVVQAEARSGGRPIVWEFNQQGYRFARRPHTLALPAGMSALAPVESEYFEHDDLLRPRRWDSEAAVQVRISPSSANVFNVEWMPDPMVVELDNGQQRWRIVRDASGRYEVEQP